MNHTSQLEQLKTLLAWQKTRGLRFPSMMRKQADSIIDSFEDESKTPEKQFFNCLQVPIDAHLKKYDIIMLSSNSSWETDTSHQGEDLLDKMISAMNFKKTAIKKVRLIDQNLKNSKSLLLEEISKLMCKVVIVLDPTTAHLLNILDGKSFDEKRGEWCQRTSNNSQIKFIITWHPINCSNIQS
ncbi:MAG: hypothetical protein R3B45_00950 [Bdellovibrionota bacterium]